MSALYELLPVEVRKSQDAVLDAIASGEFRPPVSAGTPMSLRPDRNLADACCARSEEAIAIRDAWRFRFPVTYLTVDALDELSSRCSVTFTGSAAELR